MQQDTLSIRVPRGTKVKVEEVDQPSDDPRIPKDRNVVISGSEVLKLAIKRAGAGTASRASVTLMCG